ncbi:hypothetical protein A2U01_0012258, partial [Trifolium medium]|nr:hypothetical protein [Trifolium medium]
MVISLDCTKHELLEEEHDKSSSGKPKEKLGLSNRKKKGRTRNNKRQNPAPKTPVSGISCENLHKDIDCVVEDKKKTDLTKPRELPQVPLGKNNISMGSSSSPVKIVDYTRESNVGKPRTTPRKSRKEKNKNKNKSILVDGAVVDSHKSVTHAASTTVISNGEVEICDRSFDSSTIQNVKNKDSIGNDILVSNSSPCSLNGPAKENSSTGKVEGKNVNDLADSCNSSGSQFCLLPNERKMLSCELDTRVVECKTITQPVPALKHSNFSSNEDTCSLNTTGAAKADVKPTIYDKPIRE